MPEIALTNRAGKGAGSSDYKEYPFHQLKWADHLKNATPEYDAHAATLGNIRIDTQVDSMAHQLNIRSIVQHLSRSHKFDVQRVTRLALTCLELDAIR